MLGKNFGKVLILSFLVIAHTIQLWRALFAAPDGIARHLSIMCRYVDAIPQYRNDSFF